MKKTHISMSMLIALVCPLIISCDDEAEQMMPGENNYTNKVFKYQATVQADEDPDGGHWVEMGNDDNGLFFNLFCDEACCNLSESAVMLELYQRETGDPAHPDVEGAFGITCDSNNSLSGTYYGSGARTDRLCDISCLMTPSMSRGIFYTEKTQLYLDIKGVYEQGNPEPVAYQIAIAGHLRVPK